MTGDSAMPERKRRWPWYLGVAAILIAVSGVGIGIFFPEEEKEIRRDLRNAVQKAFPEQAERVAASFGVTCDAEELVKSPPTDQVPTAVVLVHGLDDPGKVWMNLAPALFPEHQLVCVANYPNDQPIVESAWFLFDEMKALKASGIREIFIVAHSMGGLVSREMLTNPQIAYLEETHSATVPRAAGLIMVGTPNHGSAMARFRVFGEIRDQWVSLLSGRGHVLRGVLDGAGEAKIDLLPESQFLTALNERPHPSGVEMLSIAGVVSPWNRSDIDRFVSSAREKVPPAQQEALVELGALLESMSDGLGDGLVTVESTHLEGVEHRRVPGTHLSMIRNIADDSRRVPPAVPVILEYLEKWFPGK